MIPKKLLFEFKECKSCKWVHGFDIENPRVCVYAIIAAGGLGSPVTANRIALAEAIEALYSMQKVDNES